MTSDGRPPSLAQQPSLVGAAHVTDPGYVVSAYSQRRQHPTTVQSVVLAQTSENHGAPGVARVIEPMAVSAEMLSRKHNS